MFLLKCASKAVGGTLRRIIHFRFESVKECHSSVINAHLKMAFFATIGVIAFIYYLVSVILWLVCDSDIELFYKEKFGKKISKYIQGIQGVLH